MARFNHDRWTFAALHLDQNTARTWRAFHGTDMDTITDWFCQLGCDIVSSGRFSGVEPQDPGILSLALAVEEAAGQQCFVDGPIDFDSLRNLIVDDTWLASRQNEVQERQQKRRLADRSENDVDGGGKVHEKRSSR